MARGKRRVSFRTRKLSLSAPMVLPWRRGGRVGRRRTTIHTRALATRLGPSRAFGHRALSTPKPPRFRRRNHRAFGAESGSAVSGWSRGGHARAWPPDTRPRRFAAPAQAAGRAVGVPPYG